MADMLLDVMCEDLQMPLMTLGHAAKTVSQELGVTQQDRDDGKILQHAKKHDMIVVTEDKRLVSLLKADGIRVVTVTAADKARIIHRQACQEP